MNIALITLKVFSAMGGIEKVCRVMGKALYENGSGQPASLSVISMHDHTADAAGNPYFPASVFKGYGGSKFLSVLGSVKAGIKKDLVILSHVNLLPIGWLIKKISPRTKLVLVAHGIEVWQPMQGKKKKMLQSCDAVISVSRYTRQQVISLQQYPADRCFVLNNCLDPFLLAASDAAQAAALRNTYHIDAGDRVLFTLTRLAATERHKGYDKVVAAMQVLQQYPLKYVIAGKYTPEEKEYIMSVARQHGMENKVILTGYVEDNMMAAFFGMADLYVMPSNKEGFGIVFIEAMYYGLPVIGGNADGSMDALLDGKLGIAVEPGNMDMLQQAIEKMIAAPKEHQPDHSLLMEHFSYPVYKKNMAGIMEHIMNQQHSN
ncbi:MAG: glycosyltransferase family 4 protein [Ferruginibacter sp.]